MFYKFCRNPCERFGVMFRKVYNCTFVACLLSFERVTAVVLEVLRSLEVDYWPNFSDASIISDLSLLLFLFQ